MIKYHFIGFWSAFFNRDIFNASKMLELVFPCLQVPSAKKTQNVDEAQVIIYSVFMTSHEVEKLRKLKKDRGDSVFIIQWTGESRITDPNCEFTDLILGSDRSDAKNLLFPLGMFYLELIKNYPPLIPRPLESRKFCAMFCSVLTPEREKMYHEMSKYKQVDGFGRAFGRSICGRDYWDKEYLNFMSQYKFVICFENAIRFGYNTEKIVNPILTHCIPIYWGSDSIYNFVRKERFIHFSNDQDPDQVMEKVIELDNDDELFQNCIMEQPFVKKTIDELNSTVGSDHIAKIISESIEAALGDSQ